MKRSKLTAIVVLTVLVVWTIALVGSIFTDNYQPLRYVTPIVVSIVGVLIGQAWASANGKAS